MTADPRDRSFRLAPMSPLIRTLTVVLLAMPAVFLAVAVFGNQRMVVPALFLVILYSWIWLRFRPTRFVIHPDRLEVHWPLKRRAVPRQQVAEVRVLGRRALLDSTGWTVRIGAGGLWGGFGWLWTRRKGIVEMYISRTDEFVWMERPEGRPLLITPEEPAAFVQAWSGTTR